MIPYIRQLFDQDFSPQYQAETLKFDREIFSRPDVLDVLGQERDSFQEIVQLVKSRYAPSRGSVLVSGTGSGALANAIEAALQPTQLFEVDINPAVIQRRTALNAAHPQRAAVLANIQALPFAAATFLLSVAYAVFRYVQDRTAATAELLRTLHPEGCLVIAEGRKPTVIAQVAADLAAKFPATSCQRLEIPNVRLPNLTFSYYLLERDQKQLDPQLSHIIDQAMAELSLSRTETIFRLAEGSPGTITALVVRKRMVK